MPHDEKARRSFELSGSVDVRPAAERDEVHFFEAGLSLGDVPRKTSLAPWGQSSFQRNGSLIPGLTPWAMD